MPIYEYECEECHNIIEQWQSMADAPLSTCPECGAAVRKIISQSAFHLKGGGWYADGYSSKDSSSACTNKAADSDKKAACPNAASCPCAS